MPPPSTEARPGRNPHVKGRKPPPRGISPGVLESARRRSFSEGQEVYWECEGLGSYLPTFSPREPETVERSASASDMKPRQRWQQHPRRPFQAVADDGCRILGDLHGDPDADHQVFMIMGWSSCSNYWEAQTEGVGNAPPLPALGSFELCVYDNRGTGKSDRPWGYYSTTQLARDARKVMECIGWPKPGKTFHIVGHSMGGMIAQELMLMFVEEGIEVESMTLLASHSGGWRMSPPPTSLPRALVVISTCLFVTTETLMNMTLPVLHTAQYLKQRVSRKDGSLGSDVLKPLYRKRAPWKDDLWSYMPGLAGHTFACFTHKVGRHRLRRLGRASTRILVVAAGGDCIIPPSHSMHLSRALGCPFHKLEGCGHMAMTEQPGLFNAFLVAHLNDYLHTHPAGRAGHGTMLGAGGVKHAWRLPFGLAIQYLFLYPALLVIRFLVLLKELYDRWKNISRPPARPQPQSPSGMTDPKEEERRKMAKLEAEVQKMQREAQARDRELSALRRQIRRPGRSNGSVTSSSPSEEGLTTGEAEM
eukprot:Hpha_TRINITY_DN14801_c1_g3::TRINITY_DN14801_c1_g3_i1::g.169183::m.169183